MCDCISTMNGELKAYNMAITTNLIGPQGALVETYVLKPKRGFRAPKLFATFCPFCGEKYPKDGSIYAQEQPA